MECDAEISHLLQNRRASKEYDSSPGGQAYAMMYPSQRGMGIKSVSEK